MGKFDKLIEMCKNGVELNQEVVGPDYIFINRGTFQLIIPKDNPYECGEYFVYASKGHDCFSYNSLSTHVYHVINGTGVFIIDGVEYEAKPEDTFLINPNTVFTYKGNMILTFEMYPSFQEGTDHQLESANYESQRTIKHIK